MNEYNRYNIVDAFTGEVIQEQLTNKEVQTVLDVTTSASEMYRMKTLVKGKYNVVPHGEWKGAPVKKAEEKLDEHGHMNPIDFKQRWEEAVAPFHHVRWVKEGGKKLYVKMYAVETP